MDVKESLLLVAIATSVGLFTRDSVIVRSQPGMLDRVRSLVRS
jgi:hypothetical protein